MFTAIRNCLSDKRTPHQGNRMLSQWRVQLQAEQIIDSLLGPDRTSLVSLLDMVFFPDIQIQTNESAILLFYMLHYDGAR